MRCQPHNRCDGVRGSSGSSLDTQDRGLQLNIISTSTNCCQRFFISKGCTNNSLLLFRLLNTPPHQGVLSRLEHHFICGLVKYCFTPESFSTLVISRAPNFKVFQLSDTIMNGLPWQAVNRLRLLTNAEAVRPCTSSKWIALVTQHM